MTAIMCGVSLTLMGLVYNTFNYSADRIDWTLVIIPLILGWVVAFIQVIHASRTRR